MFQILSWALNIKAEFWTQETTQEYARAGQLALDKRVNIRCGVKPVPKKAEQLKNLKLN